MIFRFLLVGLLFSVGLLNAQQCFENYTQRKVTSSLLTSRNIWYILSSNSPSHAVTCPQFTFTPVPKTSQNVMANKKYFFTNGTLSNGTVYMDYQSDGRYILYINSNVNFNPKQPGNAVSGKVTFVTYYHRHGRIIFTLIICPGNAPPTYYIVSSHREAHRNVFDDVKSQLLARTGINTNIGFTVPLNNNDCSGFGQQY